MNLAELSIKRPIFITCIIALMIVIGLISYNRMPVDQFPDVSFPIVFAEVQYPGASPVDVERQISKVIEDEVSSLPARRRPRRARTVHRLHPLRLLRKNRRTA